MNKKQEFSVLGPFRVPFDEGKAAKVVAARHGVTFWKAHLSVATRRGCYVFGIRAGGGATPWYVGKATKSFKQETFTPHKLSKYAEALANSLKGTPIMYLIAVEKRKGPVPKASIDEVEEFLIQVGVAANPELLNVKGTKKATWSIRGVVRTKGKPSKAASDFKRIMKLTTPK